MEHCSRKRSKELDNTWGGGALGSGFVSVKDVRVVGGGGSGSKS